MKIARITSGILAVFLALACAAVRMPLPAGAADAPRRTVRVAVLNDTAYADQDADGEWSGLDIECMICIAQKAGFDLEFVDSSTDPDFLGSLDSGAYDIVADLVKTPEREENYLFSDEAIGSTPSTLAVRADDDRWDYGNVEQVSRMKVGVITSFASNAGFRDWCEKHGLAPRITEYADIQQMSDALRDGQIDAEVYTAFYSADAGDVQPVMKFLPEFFYYGFRKDDIALKNSVDDALAQILVGNPEYLSDLQSRYDLKYDANELPLSAGEKAYIAAHPVLTAAMIAQDAPYYEKAADGSDAGIIPDYLSLIAQDTGLRFRYVTYPTQDEAIAAVKSGSADLIGVYSGGVISAQKYDLALTDSYFTVNSLLLTRSGAELSQIRTIAVKQRAEDSITAILRRDFPDAEIREYETAQQCFSAVSTGEASALMVGLPSATWLINQTNTRTYNIVSVPGTVTDLCMAVRSDDPVLCSILNKRIAGTRENFTGLVTKDTLPRDDWKTAISRVPPSIITVTFCVLLALVLGLTRSLFLLRRRQKERTAVLAAQTETEKQKLQVEALERNAEEKNTFFANISHDMRTPLNAIIGFSALAEQETDPRKKDDYLSKIKSSGRLLNSLIDDTLTLSKGSSGKLELHPGEVYTEDVGRAVMETIRVAAAEKDITLSFDKAGYRPRWILADELNLQKLFLNILTNAVKYTPNGGHVWVKVWDVPADAADPDTCFSIRDDGIGISPAFLPHLFEPFEQEKRPGYESVGTGLGLSIVKQIVELMNGSIEVHSTVDKGTEFLVRLHFSEVKGSAAAPARDPAAPEPSLRGKKILLCEDNALNREIAVALVTKQGMKAETAANGLEGVRKFADSPPGDFDAILMDLRMPVLDGIEAAKAIRALDRPDAKTVRIIAMTADAFAEDIQRCMDAGMDGHVAKPVDPAALYRALAQQPPLR